MSALDLGGFRHPAALAALGAIFGSFLNVVIHRLPRHESLVSPPSRCPACKARIRPWDNVPILSWILLLGRCRSCRARISWRYPAVEALTAGLFVATGVSMTSLPALAAALAFGCAMIVVTFIDLDHRIIPDVITLPGTGLAIGCALAGAAVDPRQAFLGLVLGGGGLFAVAAGYRAATGRDGLGGGDIKLLAMVGAFLGPGGALLTILLGSVSGTLFACVYMLRTGAGRTAELPFGTFLAPAAIVALLAGARIMSSYWGLFQ
jgi:leader peptidase (prepilin peptidase)/N-methyltransferase